MIATSLPRGIVMSMPLRTGLRRSYPYTTPRRSTAMSVGQASGLALTVAGRAGIPVAHYSPNEVKLAVAGDGAAGKHEVQQMVARLLELAEVPDPPDAADALALALCHWWRAPLAAASAASAAPSSRLADAIAAAVAKEAAR